MTQERHHPRCHAAYSANRALYPPWQPYYKGNGVSSSSPGCDACFPIVLSRVFFPLLRPRECEHKSRTCEGGCLRTWKKCWRGEKRLRWLLLLLLLFCVCVCVAPVYSIAHFFFPFAYVCMFPRHLSILGNLSFCGLFVRFFPLEYWE